MERIAAFIHRWTHHQPPPVPESVKEFHEAANRVVHQSEELTRRVLEDDPVGDLAKNMRGEPRKKRKSKQQ